MCGTWTYFILIHSDECVLFLFSIDEFHNTVPENIQEGPFTFINHAEMFFGEAALSILHDDDWSSNSTSITVHLNFMCVFVVRNISLSIDLSSTSFLTNCLD